MKVSPSFLTADFTKLYEEIKSVEKAQWLHFDVMDGKFVEKKTYDESVLFEIKKFSSQFFDCHLMIEHPEQSIEKYIKAGADLVTFHYEASSNQILKTIKLIKDNSCQCGLSIKPDTDVKVLIPYLDQLDLVLIMSVEPGKGGQSFLPSALDKISFLNQYRKEHHLSFLLEVDGGINLKTANLVKQTGVDVIVVGSYIFNKPDRLKAIEELENV